MAPLVTTRVLDARLGSAATTAAQQVHAAPLDPATAIRILQTDPLVRAQRALYEAALLSPEKASLATMSMSGDASASIHDAARRLELILSPVSTLAPAHVRRTAFRSVPVRDVSLAQTIGEAADLAGIDADYLNRTAGRESAWNRYAFAPTSSARGLFQFVRNTWLTAVAKWGSKYGLSREAAAIHIGHDGRAYVTSPALEREILALRYEPYFAARFAAEYAAENASFLQDGLGRSPNSRELYAAHVLGAQGALRLIQTAYARPDYPAAALLPQAAAANRGLFYWRRGVPRSASELLSAFS